MLLPVDTISPGYLPSVRPRRLEGKARRGFASKVRHFNVSFTPGLSPVIGGWEKFAKPF
jgi:hypothetical protein